MNATNPEVKEAFELILKGGTPDQSNFGFQVPKYYEIRLLGRELKESLRKELPKGDTSYQTTRSKSDTCEMWNRAS